MSIHTNFHVCFGFGFYYNALFVLITISNTSSKRTNENIAKLCTSLIFFQISLALNMFSTLVLVEVKLIRN